jgi:two-component system, chemotaxis family, protein-glutamate methylesterase/glutaminase
MASEDRNPPERFSGAAYDVVAIASSAGGLTALTKVVSELPDSFPAGILVVQHLDRRHRSLMADLVSRRTALKTKQAEAGDRVRPSSILIAPPNKHLLVNPDGSIALTETELVNFVRPSADLLFESVAATYRERAIAVVLTGSGHDGSGGAQAVKKMGGTVIAQDAESSDFFGMPSSAIEAGGVDYILPLTEISTALIHLVVEGES